MRGTLNYWEVVTNGGPVVVGVLLLLLGASMASWGIIFRKLIFLRRAARQSAAFLDAFWSSKQLDQIYQAAEELPAAPLSQVFKTAYVEMTKVTAQQTGASMHDQLGGLENIQRALRRAHVQELTHLESTVPFLATTAASAPFVGLFGTVWGIMGAFHDIYAAGNANLATVAKPISEALIATAVGLFAAIPAVVAYNHFMSRIRVLDSEMENFSSDFLNIVKRHFFK